MRDTQGFDLFYRETLTRVMRYAYALVGDAADTQDVVQEAYARAWRHWRKVADHPAPEAWVRLTVSRLATDRWRRSAKWLNILARTSGPPPTVRPPNEDTVLLTAALKTLPVKQRQAVALYYLYDMPVSRIAAEMGVPENTVKSWLSRARTTLAGLLAGSGVAAEMVEVQ
ncbi:RNA polymerase sigma24 factor [Actinoplanes lobatus]|uniref:RNA polymerase sigma-70 factor (ECF subfamily) n=1 Tax=Actinoplanes lobatus TaxID=113568 RepID=A0A7W7MF33_9ACTN|nr:SigE family RNA polymerase sigma factor [Actinoplanes lobatus]MBB4747919.1 RNA polymerase sigma-70 factor (ECF subfamily) [Actinoplanes lobatus]GGN81314.1 RNA polymerase sigma24 factor [Actinoplanes lobatus]GIE41614.1 RNA polymerase sigma24 factor [Actinoplanes lobatus]